MNIQQLLQGLAERVSASASVANVYGDPVVVGSRTLIPAAQVRYAFGGGGGKKDESEGGGGGGERLRRSSGGRQSHLDPGRPSPLRLRRRWRQKGRERGRRRGGWPRFRSTVRRTRSHARGRTL